MKKVLITLVVASMLSACSSSGSKETEMTKEIMSETTTNYDNSASTDTGATVITEAAPMETKKATPPASVKHKTVKPTTTAPVSNITEPVTSTTTTTTEPVPAPVEEKKKGWSNAARDAVIGGGAGAISGAIIGKKKVKSAAIGAAVGAAGGYIIGRKKDKADTTR